MADTRFVTDYPAIARHRAEQNDEARARYRRLAVTVVVVGLLTAGGAAVSTPLALFVAAIGAGVAFFVALPGGSSVEAGALAGEEGEAAVLERLRTLPDDFTGFNRVRLPDRELPNGWRAGLHRDRTDGPLGRRGQEHAGPGLCAFPRAALAVGATRRLRQPAESVQPEHSAPTSAHADEGLATLAPEA
jgi:hypothetical protein